MSSLPSPDEERSIWFSSALEESSFCLSRSSHHWEGKSHLSCLLPVLHWLNPKQNLLWEAGTSPCHSAWASFTQHMLAMPRALLEEGLHNSSAGLWFSQQKLVLYLPAGLLELLCWVAPLGAQGVTGGSWPGVLDGNRELRLSVGIPWKVLECPVKLHIGSYWEMKDN